MSRLPLTIWSLLITAIIGVLTFPVLLACALLLIFDRSFGTSFYLSDIIINGEMLHNTGGSPILFEHLFWFLGHPEVYIILLPALGLVSEVMSVNTRKPIFGYKAMVGAMMASPPWSLTHATHVTTTFTLRTPSSTRASRWNWTAADRSSVSSIRDRPPDTLRGAVSPFSKIAIAINVIFWEPNLCVNR